MNAGGKKEFLSRYTTIFFVLFGITYMPLEPRGFGAIKLALMASSILIYFYASHGKSSKALVLGLICLALQLVSVIWYAETFRASTFFFGCGFVFMYISLYNLICQQKVFTINHFIRFLKFFISLNFIVCLIQQCCILIGHPYFPIANLTYVLGREIGCNSLFLEPSHFARHMLIFYYAYLKCNEYLRGKGRFTIREVFSKEHIIITLEFLWMMCTMGSGTAFVCLMLLSLYFVRKDNSLIIVPVSLFIFIIILPTIEFEPLQRALSVGHASSTLSQSTVIETDGSAASRITPIINSISADFSDPSVWFGKGIDTGIHEELFETTLFDDYGVLYYLASLALCISCAYQIRSLAFIFMILGVGGGAVSNIYYAWYLMIIMTVVRYFHDNMKDPEIYE